MQIEDFILESTKSIEMVERFLDEHDRVLTFIEHNPTTPAVHPATGDQSWVFGDGRYRLFFKSVNSGADLLVYLTHVIDNRQANLTIYPNNSIPTYTEED